MKLVYTHKSKNEKANGIAIYELSDSSKKKYNRNYFISRSEFTEFYLKNHNEDDCIKRLDSDYYETLTETLTEARLIIKIAEYENLIENYKSTIKHMVELVNQDTDIANDNFIDQILSVKTKLFNSKKPK